MNEYALNAYQHEVTAILNNKQTMFRRVVQPQPEPFKGGVHPSNKAIREAPYIDSYCSERKTESNPRGMSRLWCWWTEDNRQGPDVGKCPYGKPGDMLWVRETWGVMRDTWTDCGWDRDGIIQLDNYDALPKGNAFDRYLPVYRADGYEAVKEAGEYWRPSIHMPRWASRITLEVTSVQVERVQDISIEDIKAEGVNPPAHLNGWMDKAKWQGEFKFLWDTINEKRGYSWDSNPWVWVVEFKRVAAAE